MDAEQPAHSALQIFKTHLNPKRFITGYMAVVDGV
jgi:hypothetical protein